jgi:Rps23 Pro-64 3,4-dihydroxylase Tpa1-like proline 4-hydroxylase
MNDADSQETRAGSVSGNIAVLPATGTPTPTVATPVFWIEDVLGAVVGDGLLRRVSDAARQAVRDNGRASLRLEVPELAGALARVTPVVQEVLGTGDLAGNVEYAITVHGGGEHTALRTDARPGGLAPGQVSFDYFLCRRPSGFSGGELRIFDMSLRGEREECARTFRDIYPDHDTMVIYPATSWYEVRLVQCASGLAEDSRFAFHGWIS